MHILLWLSCAVGSLLAIAFWAAFIMWALCIDLSEWFVIDGG